MKQPAVYKQKAKLTTEEGMAAYKARAEERMRQHDALPTDLKAVSNEHGLPRALAMKVDRTVSCFESVFDGT